MSGLVDFYSKDCLEGSATEAWRAGILAPFRCNDLSGKGHEPDELILDPGARSRRDIIFKVWRLF